MTSTPVRISGIKSTAQGETKIDPALVNNKNDKIEHPQAQKFNFRDYRFETRDLRFEI